MWDFFSSEKTTESAKPADKNGTITNGTTTQKVGSMGVSMVTKTDQNNQKIYSGTQFEIGQQFGSGSYGVDVSVSVNIPLTSTINAPLMSDNPECVSDHTTNVKIIPGR